MRSLLLGLIIGGLCLLCSSAWANPKFDKALKHFKDFEIKQAVGLLKGLQADSSLDKGMQAKVALYLGLSYAYLRQKPKALESLRRAIQLDPSIQPPKGTPSRLQKLFKEAGGGAGGAAPTPSTPPPSRSMSFGGGDPAPARTTPPPARRSSMSFGDPAPARTTPPPKRRDSGMSFSMGFSVRKRPVPRPAPRVEPRPVPRPAPRPEPRLDPAPTPRLDPAPTPRVDPTPAPARRVAKTPGGSFQDPDAAPLFRAQPKTATPGKGGGGSALWVVGWVAAATAVALVAGGAGFGAFANSVVSQVTNETVQIDIPLAQADAERYATIANSLYIGAGVIAIGGAVCFIIAATQKKPKAKTSLRVGPQTPSKKAYGAAPAPLLLLQSTAH